MGFHTPSPRVGIALATRTATREHVGLHSHVWKITGKPQPDIIYFIIISVRKLLFTIL